MKTIHSYVGRRVWGAIAAAALGATAAGCGFLDPTEVNNPATTIDDLAEAANPTASMVPGLRAQFAQAINPTIPEVVSDNYSIHGTGINKTNDFPADITTDLIGGVYQNIQQLRALATFVIDDIIPNDDDPNPDHVQEIRYYLGMAFLLLGERFAGAPIEVDGTPLSSDALITRAITELQAAGTGGAFGLPVQAALARAYRMAGDATNAGNHAAAVLAADPDFAQARDYDPATITNNPYAFLVTRSLQEMQPLPRLDFLDPKYVAREAPIYVSKAEEMHLILAEIDFGAGANGAAKAHVADAIRLAQSRPTTSFDDSDPRLNEDLSERPHDASITVRADGSSPFRAGLVLGRPGNIPTPTIAATSLDPDSVEAISDAATEDLLHAFFLARQEMLFLEGRRMVDLGIKLPFSLNEIETNPNISAGDLGTLAIIPAHIPAQDQMDLFTPASPYDATGALTTTQVTMMVDMNRVLAQARFGPLL